MSRVLTKFAAAAIAVGFFVVLTSQDTQAGWFRHRVHASSGSHGSSGSWGSRGSRGSWGSHGSSGSWGSRGRRGSWGSHGSSGSWGSRGSHGSSGFSGAVTWGVRRPQYGVSYPYSQPSHNNSTVADSGSYTTGVQSTDETAAYLQLVVPEDAQVFLNGRLATSNGTHRSFAARGLLKGHSYTYEVLARATRDGRVIEEKRTVRLRAGDNNNLAFKLQAPAAPVTILTLRVPESAKVKLAGKVTTATGAVRSFRTTALPAGSEFTEYKIEVSVDQDGQQLTSERVITLKAGDNRQLEFNFDGANLAQSQ